MNYDNYLKGLGLEDLSDSKETLSYEEASDLLGTDLTIFDE